VTVIDAPMPDLRDDFDLVDLRRTYGCFPSGVVSICAMADGVPVGLVASSFTSVSMTPPLVSFCIKSESETWPRLERLPRLGVSVLGEAHDAACRQLSAKAGDRFAGLDLRTTAAGAVLIAGAPAWLECVIEATIPAGDHQIVLLRVMSVTADHDVPPLVFHASSFGAVRATRR
jgi:flavin reductase (DIM6/NTAB) family NADH-FMN oxidoreductase RutF